MCYSKEVQLITSLIIFISIILFYFIYSKKIKEKWKKSFLNNILLVFAMIGGHQFFEFLSLITNNQIIYKIGLTISIFSMYFLIRSLELLINKQLYSKIVLIIIAIVTLINFLTTIEFTQFLFYLRATNYFWGFIYLIIFIYWNACALYYQKQLKLEKKQILSYLILTIDVSFILSIIYLIFGKFFLNANVCSDFPSIWCTFFVIQCLLIPIFLTFVLLKFKRPKKTKTNIKTIFLLYLLSIIIAIFFSLIFPFTNCLITKFPFP